MRTIGTVLKDARVKRKFSLDKLGKETKIKKEFIKDIEQGKWENLPEYPVIVGFVRNIAQALGVEIQKALALLRRDYPPKALAVNPKPDISKEFVWNPKLTFFIGVSIIIVGILGYLIFQYVKFISPPPLQVYEPKEEQVLTETKVLVRGKTDPDATVKINNQPVLVNELGGFSEEIEISEVTEEVMIETRSRAGKITEIRRKINLELQ